MALEDLHAVEERAKAGTQAAIEQKGGPRALEVFTTKAIRAKFPDAVIGHWTARERGEAKMLLEQFGTQGTPRLVEYAVERWGFLRKQKLMDWLPPVPTFHTIYAARDQIASYLGADSAPSPGSKLRQVYEGQREMKYPEPPRVNARADVEPEAQEPIAPPDEIKAAFAAGGLKGLRDLMKRKAEGK